MTPVVWLIATLAAGTAGQSVAPRADVTLRFHHLHYTVGDPASAINHAAESSGGTRLLVSALGAGVRVGTEFILFDRAVEARSAGDAPQDVQAAYARASRWLRRREILVVESASGGARLSEHVGTARLDHVGVTADDPAAAVSAVEHAGAILLRQSPDAAMFELPDGPRLEIVRSAATEDAYWCPMHPDVRAPSKGSCPVCGMTLVPIAARRLGEYRMDVTMRPTPGGDGAAGLHLAIRQPDGSGGVTSFLTIHERLLHLFIIGRDLEFFRHVHPEPRSDGTFELDEPIPPGAYVLIADVYPQGGTPQMLQRAIVTAGYAGPLFPEPPRLDDRATGRVVDGVRVSLDARELVHGREAQLHVSFTDAATGAPIGDLEPFLGAPAHMLIVNRDLTETVHAHPEKDLPAVTFAPLMPAEGVYKLWVQFQRKGRVSTAAFVVTVR